MDLYYKSITNHRRLGMRRFSEHINLLAQYAISSLALSENLNEVPFGDRILLSIRSPSQELFNENSSLNLGYVPSCFLRLCSEWMVIERIYVSLSVLASSLLHLLVKLFQANFHLIFWDFNCIKQLETINLNIDRSRWSRLYKFNTTCLCLIMNSSSSNSKLLFLYP